MRHAWLKTFAAVACISTVSATSAMADPASMAMRARKAGPPSSESSFWPWSKPEPAGTPTLEQVTGQERPSASISPAKHPIKYLKATFSEMPIAGGKAASAPRGVLPPAKQPHDALSLDVPTGPPSPEFFIYAAQACERQNDVPQARANYQRALSIWPGQIEVLRAAAQMEDRQGNLPVAENLYQQAVAMNPQHAGALNDLGICLARQGKLAVSAQVLEQAVILQPGKPLYRNNAATVLVEMRQDQRALGHLAAVHGAAEANYNLGQLLVARNRSAEAAPYFQAALQYNPTMQPAQEALAKLQSTPVVPAVPVGNPAPASVPQMAQAAPTATSAAQPVQPGAQQPAPAPSQAMAGSAAQAVPATTPPTTQPQYLPSVATRPEDTQRR